MKTLRGIYRDIRESDYYYTYEGMTFYFSSEFYRDKFIGEIEEKLNIFHDKVNSVYKYKFYLKMDKLGLIRLYDRIEKRGFRVIIEGIEVDCLNKIQFVSEIEIVN